MPHRGLDQNVHPEAYAWGIQFSSSQDHSTAYHTGTEHITMTRLNPPTGFTGRDWSEEIGTDEPTSKPQFKSDEDALKEDLRFRGPVPIPLSVDGGKTLDWSRPEESESSAHASIYLNPVVHRELQYSICDLPVLTERFTSRRKEACRYTFECKAQCAGGSIKGWRGSAEAL